MNKKSYIYTDGKVPNQLKCQNGLYLQGMQGKCFWLTIHQQTLYGSMLANKLYKTGVHECTSLRIWFFKTCRYIHNYTPKYFKDTVKNGIITCLHFSYAKDCGMLPFSVNKSSPSVIFRAFLLPEKGSKNSTLNWVLKLNLDQQTF